MRGDATVLQHLNAVLKNELTAINQYFLHSAYVAELGRNQARQVYVYRRNRSTR